MRFDLDETIQVQATKLTLEKFCTRLRVPQQNLTLRTSRDFYTEDAIFEIVRMVAQLPSEATIRYPSTWWDAVKEHFAPRWFLQRWPAAYTEHHAVAQFPEMPVPLRSNEIVYSWRRGCAS